MYIEDKGIININNKSQLYHTMFIEKYGSLDLYDEDMEKYLSLSINNYNLVKIMDGIYFKFSINLMVIFIIMKRFEFMVIYLI